MALLTKAINQQAYLKFGTLGFPGAGKTFTAMLIATGLHKYIKSDKPVAFLDTETGSDWVISKFEKAGIELLVKKTRAFKDLLAVVDEAEQTCDIIIVDSISHIWVDLLQSYLKSKNKTRLAFQDWGIIKPTWAKFTDKYLNSKIHFILCGRAAIDYDYFENDEGKMELYKKGTKMRAETEMGYEPSLLFEMERESKKNGVGWNHRCTILKDRSDTMDGMVINNPSFEDFLPMIETLNLGGEHLAVDTSRTSEDMFDDDGRGEYEREQKDRKKSLEEIQGELVKAFPSTSGKEKKAKLVLMEAVFGTNSWSAIEQIRAKELESGLRRIKPFLKTKKNIEDMLESPEDAAENIPAPTINTDSDDFNRIMIKCDDLGILIKDQDAWCKKEWKKKRPEELTVMEFNMFAAWVENHEVEGAKSNGD